MILPMMFILFLGLKLGEVVTWGWWIVCLPLIAMGLRWIVAEAIKEGVKLQMPWAIKLVTWLKN